MLKQKKGEKKQLREKLLLTLISNINKLYAAYEKKWIHYNINVTIDQKFCCLIMQWQVRIPLYNCVSSLTDVTSNTY